jgi:ribosomal protein S18 acetylase RimI-like enzyme
MSEAYAIRRAAAGDEAAVAALFTEMFDYHRQFDPVFSLARTGGETYAKWFVQQVGQPGALALVADDGGRIVGFCMALVRKRTRVHEDRYQTYGEIDDLSVTASHRARGIGRSLVSNAMEWLRMMGVERVEARVATSNHLSEEFWRGQGFKPYMTLVWRDVSA